MNEGFIKSHFYLDKHQWIPLSKPSPSYNQVFVCKECGIMSMHSSIHGWIIANWIINPRYNFRNLYNELGLKSCKDLRSIFRRHNTLREYIAVTNIYTRYALKKPKEVRL